MNKPTHVLGGIVAGLTTQNFILSSFPHVYSTSTFSELFIPLSIMCGSMLGSVFPDIDHKGSFIGKRLKIASSVIHHLFGHRGITHSPFFCVGLSSLLAYVAFLFLSGWLQTFSLYLLLGFFVGMASHLLLDAITPSGIPLLYPVTKKRFSFAPIRTGSKGEAVVFFLLLLLCLFLVRNAFYILIS